MKKKSIFFLSMVLISTVAICNNSIENDLSEGVSREYPLDPKLISKINGFVYGNRLGRLTGVYSGFFPRHTLPCLALAATVGIAGGMYDKKNKHEQYPFTKTFVGSYVHYFGPVFGITYGTSTIAKNLYKAAISPCKLKTLTQSMGSSATGVLALGAALTFIAYCDVKKRDK